MRNRIWLIAPCAALFLAACDASETVAPVVATPERTVVLDPNATRAAPPEQNVQLGLEPPLSETERAEAAQRAASAKARVAEIKERLGRPERRRLRDRD